MPELPEVEVVCQGLRPLLSDRKVSEITFSNRRLRLPVPMGRLKKLVKGRTIMDVGRRAKYLIIVMDNQARLLIHLGMTGKLGLFPAGSIRARHDHLRFSLDNGMELRFNDTRRFGSVQLFVSARELQEFFAPLGPEPFSQGFSAGYMEKMAKKRGRPLKNLIMDSRVVVGIGNIYASEILHEAGINPCRPAADITRRQWQEIVSCCRTVLTKAIAAGGSTIADFVNSSGQQGYFQLQLKVYGRKGQVCGTCGAAIIKQTLAGRATYSCPVCQP